MQTYLASCAEADMVVSGYVSVGAWELECQRMLVKLAVPTSGLSVLEIGYGLGLASTAIQTGCSPALHVTVEANPAVACGALGRRIGNEILIVSRWQSIFRHLAVGTFDSIVFDPDPEVPADISWNSSDVANWALPGITSLSPLLRPGGRFGCLDFTNQLLLTSDFSARANELGLAVDSAQVPISPPNDCKYARPGYATVVVATKRLTVEGGQ